MSQLEQVIKEAVKNILQDSQIKTICWGVAKDIKETSCTVERDGAPELYDVLLNAVDDDLQNYLTVYPKEGSNVLVAIIENLKTEAVVIRCSEVEKLKVKIGEQTLTIDKEGFVFNDGVNKGMVKIVEMVNWMTKVYADLQTLQTLLKTHPVAGNGSPLALAFMPTAPAPTVAMFENKDIQQ